MASETAVRSGLNRSGGSWTPKFVMEINADKCIGCGRCFKVCGRDILELRGITEDGDVVELDSGGDEEINKKIMTIVHPEFCIGCEACAKVCPKKCYTHAELPA